MINSQTKLRLELFEKMLLVRRFEELVVSIYPRHEYIGRQHLYIGHEATAAGVTHALTSDDLVFSTHRCHGYVLGRGIDLGQALAEIMGRDGGSNRGRGGPWHIADVTKGVPMTSAQLGGGAGLGVGAAFGLMRMGRPGVSVVHMGDGTLPEGIAYEAFNMASVFKLPVLFVCENNAVVGQRGGLLAVETWEDVPRSLSIHCEPPVDGGDCEAVHETASRALRRVREGGGPVFMRTNIVSWPGASLVVPGLPTGVTQLRAVVDPSLLSGRHVDWSQNDDPILGLARRLLTSGEASDAQLSEVDEGIGKALARALAFAEASPFPDPETAADFVFA